MATKILISISEDEAGKSKAFFVQEPFDAVIEKIWPAQQQPSSALESRANMTHTLTNGKRVVIPHGYIAYVEEDVEEDG